MADDDYHFKVDDREPKEFQLSMVQLGAMLDRMEYGDVQVGPWIIERKEAGDFLASILDGRLIEQAFRIRESGKEPIIVVEGYLNWKTYNSIKGMQRGEIDALYHGALATLTGTARIPVVPTMHKAATFAFIKSLLKRVDDPIVEIEVPVVKLKKRTTYEAMLAQIPGIGKGKASEIAERFPSFSSLMESSLITMVDYMGQKTAEEVYRALYGGDIPLIFKHCGYGKRVRDLIEAHPDVEVDLNAVDPDTLQSFLTAAGMKKLDGVL